MRPIFLLALPLALSLAQLPAAAQTQPVVKSVETQPVMHTFVEQMPTFPGPSGALQQYLNTNRRYPAAARAQGVAGKVYVSFVVQPDGSITDAKVEKGLGAGCDEEALRLIRQMPRWTPARQNGRVVLMSYTLPVPFSLSEARP